ncbi:hypothetical protein ACQ4PT_036478 [Festuca glaucescens]
MDHGKKREIVEGKNHVVEEELSSAAENDTPQYKLMRDAMKGGNQEKPLQMYKTRITAAALSEALKEADVGDEDAIAVDFDEVKKNMQSHLVVIGIYVTTQIYSIRGLFGRMRQIWQLRGGMVEKELDGNKFLIKFEQKGDFNHVLKGGPWLYQDYPMLVAEYDGKSSLADFPVNSKAVWVRVMDIPPGMMTEKWARKMGDQLGTYKEIAKESKNQVWDKFYRVRIVVDVNHLIRRWVKFQDQKTKEMIRYDVKYERMPVFCYFCGIVGHSDKHCLLPKEEKRIGDVSGTDGVSQERVEIDAAPEDTEEDRTETANPEDVLQMVAAVENLKMQEGKGIINNQIVTDEQVSNVAGNLMAKKRWVWRFLPELKKLQVARARPGGQLPQEALGAPRKSPLMRIPPIEACLRPDSSLLEELRADAARTASSFLK